MKKSISIIFFLILLLGCYLPSFAQNEILKLPAGSENTVTLDGQLEGEWADAIRYDLVGGGVVLLKQDPKYLYVAFQGKDEGWGHIYVYKPDSIFVLHASAALGTAIYVKANSGEWNVSDIFSWEVRGTAMDEEAAEIRKEYLSRNRWIASTTLMGDRNVIEYKLDKLLLAHGDQRMAFVYASDPKKPHYWPASIEDATIDPDLIFGNTPEVLGFNPALWSRVRFE